MSFQKLSAFSLASFEMNAHAGGTHRFATAVSGLSEQVSLSPQAMGVIGVPVNHSAFNQPEPEEHGDEEEFLEEDEFEDEEFEDVGFAALGEDSVYISSEE